jgi:hypothetical protein
VNARLDYPDGVAVFRHDVVFSDLGNLRVRGVAV